MKRLVFIVILGFWGCDIYAPYQMYIDNQTEDTIEVIFLEGSPYSMIDPSYLTFPPRTKKIFYDIEATATKHGCDYTGINEGGVEVHASSGRKLLKNIWDINNWNCQGSFRGGWTQTFIITEADLGNVD